MGDTCLVLLGLQLPFQSVEVGLFFDSLKACYNLELFIVDKRKLRGVFICVYKFLKGGHKEGGARLFPVVPYARTRASGYNLEQRRPHTNMRKHCFTVRVMEHWFKLPSVESLP